jgi:hypothetical protein
VLEVPFREPYAVTTTLFPLLVRRALVGLVVLSAVTAPCARAASRYDPALRFQSITTAHFVIHYHQGEEALALRLAAVAEREHAVLVRRFGHEPRARTHVVLVDQDDEPNGWTTVLPYNLIELRAAPPSGASSIGNTDDWIRTVFVHEYAHVLHIDPARGWARAARTLFGRAFFAFPNALLPEWQAEGIATWAESAGGDGRVHAGDFRAIVSEAARAGRLEPIDRVSGGLASWPSGYGWYAYGAFFHEYLAERFGAETLAALSARTSGRLPYLSSGAFRSVFGQSLGSLWREFEAAERRRIGTTAAGGDTPVPITARGYLTDGPRFDTDGSLLYSRQDADVFPVLERARPGAAPERVTTRYGGGQVAPAPGAIYFDQLELLRSVGMVSDLYRMDRATGDVRRLTRGARLSEPDVSPDGRRIAAIRTQLGARRLVVLDRAALDAGGESVARALDAALVLGPPGAIMATPRWSPDGTRIAVESREVHGPSTIVVFDVDDGEGQVVAQSGGRSITPSWTPDGDAIVFAEAGPGEPFNLSCTRLVDGGRYTFPLTSLTGGARSPDISPDGRTVAFVGYTPSGSDVFTLPFSCPSPLPAAPGGSVGGGPGTLPEPPPPPPARSPARRYSPWSTLAPRSWLPLVDTSDGEVRVGAWVGGEDALGYHAWTASATWSVERSTDLEPVSPGARPDLSFGYVYDRWRPSFFAQYGDETTPLRVYGDDPVARPVALRERSGEVGVTLLFRRVRVAQALVGSYLVERDTVSGPVEGGSLEDASLDRAAVRGGWTLVSAKRYGRSIGLEGGVAIGAGVERAAAALGGDGDATFVRADVRAYLPLGPPHAVLALRATGARSGGDLLARRVLRLGGSDADAAVLSFDEDASSLLRSFESGRFAGTRLALVNAEYRLPLARIERGFGTWPLFLRTVHATGFYDVGDAWSTGGPRLSDWKSSWGGELSSDVVLGFRWPLTVTAGAAWGRDGEGLVAPTRTAYVRIGRGF